VVKNIIFILQIICYCFQHCQNQLTVDEVIAKSSTARFLKLSVEANGCKAMTEQYTKSNAS